MPHFRKTVALVSLVAAAASGCVKERPATSDLEGPVIRAIFTGGADFILQHDDRRPNPADRCAIVSGAVIGRSVDVEVIFSDASGMNWGRFSVEGEGIQPGSISVAPDELDVSTSFSNTDFLDEIEVRFAPLGANVRTGAILSFTIESTFTPGVTVRAFARDSFGNDSTLADFELVSELGGPCNNG